MAAYRERPRRGHFPNDPPFPQHTADDSCALCGAASIRRCRCPWRAPFEDRAWRSLLDALKALVRR